MSSSSGLTGTGGSDLLLRESSRKAIDIRELLSKPLKLRKKHNKTRHIFSSNQDKFMNEPIIPAYERANHQPCMRMTANQKTYDRTWLARYWVEMEDGWWATLTRGSERGMSWTMWGRMRSEWRRLRRASSSLIWTSSTSQLPRMRE